MMALGMLTCLPIQALSLLVRFFQNTFFLRTISSHVIHARFRVFNIMSDNLRPISITLVAEAKQVKRFTLTQWRIAELALGDQGDNVLNLQLSMTERAAYRFNLTSTTPRLFVRAGFAGQTPKPDAITASQDVAAGWMDGEQQVLEAAMPMAIQVWLENYLARHGEAPMEMRKKKRKGAGRAKDTPSKEQP
mgnify:CR=1 FL=1